MARPVVPAYHLLPILRIIGGMPMMMICFMASLACLYHINISPGQGGLYTGWAIITMMWGCILSARLALSFLWQQNSTAYMADSQAPNLANLLQLAHHFDHQAKDTPPAMCDISDDLRRYALMILSLILGLSLMAMGQFLSPSGLSHILWTPFSGLGALFLTSIALMGGVLYTQINHPWRLKAMTYAGGAVVLGGMVISALQYPANAAPAANVFIPEAFYVFTYAIAAFILLPLSHQFYKYHRRHNAGAAKQGICILVLAALALCFAHNPAHILAILFAASMAGIAQWFQLLNHYRPNFRLFLR